MKFECPSCFICWKDQRFPKEEFHHSICGFCAKNPKEKDLLEWQIRNINIIETEKIPSVIKNLYFYFNLQLSILEERLHEYHKYKEKEP